MNLHLIAKNQSDRVQAIPLEELYCHVDVENSLFLDKMADSIEEYGMQNPIIVLPMTIRQWKQMQEVNEKILDPPDGHPDTKILQVRCGNNRYRVAHMLGYTTIDCIIAENIREATTFCIQQRTQQTIWHMENKYGVWNR